MTELTTADRAEVLAVYRLGSRDVRVTQRSPLPAGGYIVVFKTDDGGVSTIDAYPEHIFLSQAQRLVGLDDAVALDGEVTTFRSHLETNRITALSKRDASLDGPVPTIYNVTIWQDAQLPMSYPVSRETYTALREAENK